VTTVERIRPRDDDEVGGDDFWTSLDKSRAMRAERAFVTSLANIPNSLASGLLWAGLGITGHVRVDEYANDETSGSTYTPDEEAAALIASAEVWRIAPPPGSMELARIYDVVLPFLIGGAVPSGAGSSSAFADSGKPAAIVGVAESSVPVSQAASPTRIFVGTSHGDLVATAEGAIQKGLGREMRVAEMVGGRVARAPGRSATDIAAHGGGMGVSVDVFGPSGELYIVGGPAKARNLSAVGDNARRLRHVADSHGVRAGAYFEEGTPEAVLDIARRHLGADNVHTFKP
jgi:hypothetical protein